MDLEFTEEQEMLRNLVRQVCSDHAPLTVVRELEDDPVGYQVDLWKQLANLDLIGLLIPTEYGGSGMSLIEGAIVYEEFGRALAPLPHFVSAVLSAGAIARGGTDEQKQNWLPSLASGDSIFSVAWLEPDNSFRPSGVQMRAIPNTTGTEFTLRGVKRHVQFARAADHLVVLARCGDDLTDLGLFVVPTSAPGLMLEQQFSIASDPQFKATFEDVTVPASHRLPGGWDAWEATMFDAVVLAAAQAIGGAQYSLDITVQYSKDRVQFDKPLGAFQALAHYMADAKTTVDGGQVLVWEAAWARANGRPEGAKLAAMAKLFCCQTFRDVTAMAQQIHGGVGFTLEYDIQLYFRRAKALQLNWWDTRELEERIATAVLD
ncbi:MAG: acyl-CoA/acyl-ACP dehydrogenase [Acidimicrobiales bacterium]|nr:acyl-CoA/acyl-ACP dehydrogenase [Acidimicrobiales bacterium]